MFDSILIHRYSHRYSHGGVELLACAALLSFLLLDYVFSLEFREDFILNCRRVFHLVFKLSLISRTKVLMSNNSQRKISQPLALQFCAPEKHSAYSSVFFYDI